mmetsp:Transcript_35626/g.101515  ORF Transcript_35626/g.101515 Transcript_35626/m.101515 type:complete len:391 (-) Transcript_35626:89-1261(-)
MRDRSQADIHTQAARPRRGASASVAVPRTGRRRLPEAHLPAAAGRGAAAEAVHHHGRHELERDHPRSPDLGRVRGADELAQGDVQHPAQDPPMLLADACGDPHGAEARERLREAPCVDLAAYGATHVLHQLGEEPLQRFGLQSALLVAEEGHGLRGEREDVLVEPAGHSGDADLPHLLPTLRGRWREPHRARRGLRSARPPGGRRWSPLAARLRGVPTARGGTRGRAGGAGRGAGCRARGLDDEWARGLLLVLSQLLLQLDDVPAWKAKLLHAHLVDHAQGVHVVPAVPEHRLGVLAQATLLQEGYNRVALVHDRASVLLHLPPQHRGVLRGEAQGLDVGVLHGEERLHVVEAAPDHALRVHLQTRRRQERCHLMVLVWLMLTRRRSHGL